MTTDFSKAKIGDKVFDRFRQEWGVITSIDTGYTYPITVVYSRDDEGYTKFGFVLEEHAMPALVWGQQTPAEDWNELPEMPKRIVKRKVEGYVNVYPNEFTCHFNKEQADWYADKTRVCGFHVSHEYEIGEE